MLFSINFTEEELYNNLSYLLKRRMRETNMDRLETIEQEIYQISQELVTRQAKGGL